jgi:beta-N-acetylhexosaminidase
MTTHAPIILDVAGLTLTKIDTARLDNPLTGGVILFARNWKDRKQLTQLCAQIKAVRSDLLILTMRVGGCSGLRPMGLRTCRRCAPWVRCG